jgi:DNA repair protein RecN (Recombination protein N)
MLTQLTIQNFGLIDNVALELEPKLNILTGETGAGKSIVIDALRIALGERTSTSQIRDPEQPCHIEAVFFLKNSHLLKHDLLQEYFTDGPELIISRHFYSDGRNKIKVNGFSLTVTQLREIGNTLIDFHGPHDHQSLLSESSHIGMLDRLANLDKEIEDYNELYRSYQAIKQKLSQLQQLSQGRERELDLLSHQIKELEQVSLKEDEYEKLLQERVKINNAERLYQCINQLLNVLGSEEGGVSERIRQAFSPMKSLNQIDEKTSQLMDILSEVQDDTEDLVVQLQDYTDGLSFDSAQAEDINVRYDIYDEIKRKYGPSLEAAEHFYVEAKKRYNLLANFEQEDSALKQEINLVEAKLKQKAQKLTQKRQKGSSELKGTIEKELTELGMPKVKFDVKIAPVEFNDRGADHVVFYISPNVGESLKPLADIVSSGEAARVMLALKKALIKVDSIPVLIFDEIDAQIGGRLGTTTGEKLRDIAAHRQVILITHLPQIASFADAHFKVTKNVKAGRSITQVNLLNKEERIKELAQMMSGEKESKIALKHAGDMLANAKG